MADRARLDELQRLLDATTRSPELADALGFGQRCDTIDLLELHLAGLSSTQPADEAERAGALRDQAVALCHLLQEENAQVIQGLRLAIQAGRLRREDLAQELVRYGAEPPRCEAGDNLEYDNLDALVAGILGTDGLLDDDRAETLPDMIPYQPTPARVILEIVKQTNLSRGDIFVDIGSGLGAVPTLASLLSGAASIGIEVQPSYCRHAEECARRLGLGNVRFVCQDARHADLSVGTVFYMHTPFKGGMLQEVLERVHAEGCQRRIRLCVYGPILAAAVQQPWFPGFERSDLVSGPIAIFDSKPT